LRRAGSGPNYATKRIEFAAIFKDFSAASSGKLLESLGGEDYYG
jgi:hypothetical protein